MNGRSGGRALEVPFKVQAYLLLSSTNPYSHQSAESTQCRRVESKLGFLLYLIRRAVFHLPLFGSQLLSRYVRCDAGTTARASAR